MNERYNYVHMDDTWTCICPFRFNNGERQNVCEGGRCMAWIYALDDKGELTKSGRCGLLADIKESLKEGMLLTTLKEYTCLIGPEYPDSVSIPHDEKEGGEGNE